MSEVAPRLTAALADRYRIERELGAGGMATVYLAEDLKHHRQVAIKVLKPELAAVVGGERFLLEIKTTANLQHPHILPLFDSGVVDGLVFYAMPFVEGESLRDRLTREKQLPLEDALGIAREVADALHYAHARGVIHRDIKPENILLQGGHALVADFGIAMAASLTGGTRMTETGMSLGTPTYMSPEQAMGERTLDARSDVYALGCVLYEMLVGDPPHTGSTAQAIVGKVLTERAAPPSAARDTVPPHVDQAVLRALAKLPADRWPSTQKFAEALERADVSPAEPPSRVARHAARSANVGAAAKVVLALVVTAVVAWWLGRGSVASSAPWSTFTQLTDASGVETSPSLSPDGESFAYSSDARGSWDIYVQRVGGRNPVLVAGDTARDESWPAYSPDGRQIAYAVLGDGIFMMGATGESPRRVTSVGSNPAWSPDGQQIAFGSEDVYSPYSNSNTGELWIVDVSGGEPRRLETPGDAYQPSWSPGGTRIAYWTASNGQRDLMTIPAGGGAALKVTDDVAVDWAPIWSPDGDYLWFSSDRGGSMGIWRIAVDEATGRARGTPELIASGADVTMDLPHLSRDGTSLIFRSKIESVNPAVATFDPVTRRIGPVTLLQHRTGVLAPNDVSPDGSLLALFNGPGSHQDVFLMHSDGSDLKRLTDDDARDWFPTFAPDGQSVFFFSNQGGKYNGWSIRLDGSGRTQLSAFSTATIFPQLGPHGARNVVAFPANGAVIGTGSWPLTESTSTVLPGMEVDSGMLQPSDWSPDGRWLVGSVYLPSGELRGNALYDLDSHRSRRLSVDARGGFEAAWLPDRQHILYFTNRDALVIQDIFTLERRVVAEALPYPPNQLGSIAMSPDGRSLYYAARQVEANIWLLKGPTAEQGAR